MEGCHKGPTDKNSAYRSSREGATVLLPGFAIIW